MKSALKIATSERSPARQALAEKIADLAAARQRSAAIKSAIITASQAVSAANSAVDAAVAAIEKAKINGATYLTEQELGTAGPAPQTIKEARQAEQDAKDMLDAAQSALEQLKKQETPADNSVIYTEMAVNTLTRDVIKSEAPVSKMLADFATAQREYAARYAVLEWLVSSGAIVSGSFRAMPPEWMAAGQAPWNAAVAALATDPDAALPTG